MLNSVAIINADLMSVCLKSTGISCTTSHAEVTSSFFNAPFFIIAVSAFPISKGKTSGAIKSPVRGRRPVGMNFRETAAILGGEPRVANRAAGGHWALIQPDSLNKPRVHPTFRELRVL